MESRRRSLVLCFAIALLGSSSILPIHDQAAAAPTGDAPGQAPLMTAASDLPAGPPTAKPTAAEIEKLQVVDPASWELLLRSPAWMADAAHAAIGTMPLPPPSTVETPPPPAGHVARTAFGMGSIQPPIEKEEPLATIVRGPEGPTEQEIGKLRHQEQDPEQAPSAGDPGSSR